MPNPVSGLHHVTAICGDPDPNAEFYVGTLGLRLVKHTVNHDDPHTLHLYYGDGHGSPGTNITFFPWTGNQRKGSFGAGQTRDTAYLIAPDSLDYWRDRLESRDVEFTDNDRFDEPVLSFEDPDGIGIELVASPVADDADAAPWADGPVPEQHQLRGFHGVTLGLASTAPTRQILTEVLGYESVGDSGQTTRLQAADGGPGSVVDLVEVDSPRGRMGVGAVHHVAFGVADDDHQQQIRQSLRDAGLAPTKPVDRYYFTSVYCREPGGVLFEFATPEPGFTRDEDLDELGTRLVLPDWLEDQRDEIQSATPALMMPEW